MKTILFKITSFLMALVVVFSTFSFTVAQHYCGDDFVSFSFVGKAESCGMEIQQIFNSEECNLTKKDCCDDKTISMSGQQDLKLSFEKYSFEQYQCLISLVYSYINLFEGLEENIIPFSDYPPLVLVKEIHILDQTFLI